MWWLWIVGPVAVALIYILTGLRPDRRRSREVERWRADFAPTLSKPKEKPAKKGGKKGAAAPPPGPREVITIPGELARAVEETGAGSIGAYYELIPKLGYLAIVDADAACSSDYQVVVAKLGKTAPTFVARPLPIVEGSRVANTGVQFKKDPAFMDLFLVEGTDAAAIGKWLRKSIRAVLRENPDVWLYVRGRAMAVALYGSADATQIDDLLVCADSIFAEVGAEGGPSLLGEDDSDAEDDEDEDEDEDEDDEQAESPRNLAHPKRA